MNTLLLFANSPRDATALRATSPVQQMQTVASNCPESNASQKHPHGTAKPDRQRRTWHTDFRLMLCATKKVLWLVLFGILLVETYLVMCRCGVDGSHPCDPQSHLSIPASSARCLAASNYSCLRDRWASLSFAVCSN